MGHQRKRPLLEPVLENYMGPPISYGHSAKVAPEAAAAPSKAALHLQSLNPVHIFGKLRDKYVKAMNEVSMSGDLASLAGHHGCATDPGAAEQHAARREKEIRALREELAASNSIAVDAKDDSDDDEDRGVGAHHHQ